MTLKIGARGQEQQAVDTILRGRTIVPSALEAGERWKQAIAQMGTMVSGRWVGGFGVHTRTFAGARGFFTDVLAAGGAVGRTPCACMWGCAFASS